MKKNQNNILYFFKSKIYFFSLVFFILFLTINYNLKNFKESLTEYEFNITSNVRYMLMSSTAELTGPGSSAEKIISDIYSSFAQKLGLVYPDFKLINVKRNFYSTNLLVANNSNIKHDEILSTLKIIEKEISENFLLGVSLKEGMLLNLASKLQKYDQPSSQVQSDLFLRIKYDQEYLTILKKNLIKIIETDGFFEFKKLSEKSLKRQNIFISILSSFGITLGFFLLAYYVKKNNFF